MILGVLTGATTVIDKVVNALPPPPAALTVKLKTPATVGVPDITPAEESVSPGGIEPAATAQVMGVVPVATSVW